jgi:catechol 2,3-dioxygenase-like lactoylglutathione lyase family enzyme
MTRLARVTLNARDAAALAAFYIDVLDFERIDPDSGETTIALRLGDSRLDLVTVGDDARPYPPDVAGWSPLFQHCAIVVDDMARAMDRLHASTAWSTISTDGPQTLPLNTGGVTAFKFRDPEGHPLELLAFADHRNADDDRPFVRIDHVAISVADIDRAIAFHEALGLRVTGRSLNVGIEQQRLDDVPDATVDVVALASSAFPRPHVELLGYRGAWNRDVAPARIDDVAATCRVFEVDDRDALMAIVIACAPRLVDRPDAPDRRGALLRDPDGHLLRIRIAG